MTAIEHSTVAAGSCNLQKMWTHVIGRSLCSRQAGFVHNLRGTQQQTVQISHLLKQHQSSILTLQPSISTCTPLRTVRQCATYSVSLGCCSGWGGMASLAVWHLQPLGSDPCRGNSSESLGSSCSGFRHMATMPQLLRGARKGKPARSNATLKALKGSPQRKGICVRVYTAGECRVAAHSAHC